MAQHTRRKSVFKEVGLSSDDNPTPLPSARKERPQSVRFRSRDEIHVFERYHDSNAPVEEHESNREQRSTGAQLLTVSQSPLPDSAHTMIYRLGICLLLIAAAVPLLPRGMIDGHKAAVPLQGVSGGPIPDMAMSDKVFDLDKRADSPTDICFRWAQQSAVVNGTLYLYGGEATTTEGQTSNTWNNNFLTVDLTKTWQITGPELEGLPRPSGPPSVSLGYLWNSYDSLFLYGGEFSSDPPVTPPPNALWEYDIKDASWIEHSNPETSGGKSSADDGGQPVQRSAEGAGVSVPSLGRGFYFGGHEDAFTTPGWSVQVWRTYLQSLLEYTFPGYSNSQVTGLSNDNTAGSEGAYRNITNAGLQDTAGFTKRADGLLIYVPGFGAQGILLALGGGTNTTFTQMNVINVYDIAESTWYLQSTSGPTPDTRVNPCSVIAAAPDGSSYNIYMFGGQNLIPYGNQTQFQDMWILTLPTFTWIKVDQGGQSVPVGRSGATCNVWDAQMVMVGGYVGKNTLSCDSPGFYVFDLSNLQWVNQFTALSAKGSDASDNPLNQQINQKASGGDPGGLQGSYGYQVPEAVISVIGGNREGSATITTPIVTATAGPLASGSPVTYTVAGPNGAVITEAGGNPSSTGGGSSSAKSGPNIAAIVVGVVCGLLFLVICYLLFCLFLYRKQLALYKRHVEMTQRQAAGEKPPAIPGLWTSDSAKTSTDRPKPPAGLFVGGEGSSGVGSHPSHGISQTGSGGQVSSSTAAGGYSSVRRSSDVSSTDEDLLAGREPTFVGVMLHPRRSLRVTNRD